MFSVWIGFSSPIGKEFEAIGFSTGTTTPAVAGGAVRKAQAADFHFTKHVDDISPKLMLECSRGTTFKLVTVELYNNKTNALSMSYKLKNVLITSLQTGGGEIPTESVTVSAETITWEYFKPAGDP